MGARKPSGAAIQFVEPFDHVTVGRTVAYNVGDVVEAPGEELVAAAGGRAVPVAAPEPEKPDDGE
jgi:hypothetical protein